MNVKLSLANQSRPSSTFSPRRASRPTSVPVAEYVFVKSTLASRPALVLPSHGAEGSVLKPARADSVTE